MLKTLIFNEVVCNGECTNLVVYKGTSFDISSVNNYIVNYIGGKPKKAAPKYTATTETVMWPVNKVVGFTGKKALRKVWVDKNDNKFVKVKIENAFVFKRLFKNKK